jgi:hypothetical protein
MNKTVRLAVGTPMHINTHRMAPIDSRSQPFPITHGKGPALTPSSASPRAGHFLRLIGGFGYHVASPIPGVT